MTEKRKTILIRTLFAVTFTLAGVAIAMIVQWFESRDSDAFHYVKSNDGKITFHIPFETTSHYWRGNTTYFNTDLTYEQMKEKTVGSNYGYTYDSELFEIEGRKTILITVKNGTHTVYFTISDVPDIVDRLEIKGISPEDAALLNPS